MRTLIPLLLLAVAGYIGWFYWQEYTDRPLSEPLLLTDFDRLASVTIARGKQHFQLLPAEDNRWVVKDGVTEIYDQTERVGQLFRRLAALRTDSVMRRFPDDGFVRVQLKQRGAGPQVQGEVVDLAAGKGGPDLARVVTTGDVFALAPGMLGRLQPLFEFRAYRGGTTLRLAAQAVDSLTVSYRDSVLWRVDSARVAPLSQRFLAPAPAPNADYFDEISDREKYFATLRLYAAGKAHRVEVFRDSSWASPYVLVGEDFPRRFFALDSLR